MTRILIADTETTGLDNDARVVEYAHLECELVGNHLVERSRFETLVNPGRPIPAQATAVHGITDAMVKTAPSIREILPAALNVKKGEHIQVFGHNFPGYDMKLLDGVYPKGIDIGCSLKAARTFITGAPGHSLDKLREFLKLPSTGRAHSALADCLDTLGIINHMLDGREWEIVESCMLQQPTTISFGKHKGTKLEDLPEDYVGWLLNKCDNVGWDLRRALEALV
jgi:DNA polymerase III epsilon subunit-like protein